MDSHNNRVEFIQNFLYVAGIIIAPQCAVLP